MRKEVEAILKRHGIEPQAFIKALEAITLLYDKRVGLYPEHAKEGRSLFDYCEGLNENDAWWGQEENGDWEKWLNDIDEDSV